MRLEPVFVVQFCSSITSGSKIDKRRAPVPVWAALRVRLKFYNTFRLFPLWFRKLSICHENETFPDCLPGHSRLYWYQRVDAFEVNSPMTLMTKTAVNKLSLLSQAFDGLSEDDLQELAAMTRLGQYPPSHVLCHEGAYEEIFYIIAEGQVSITKKISDSDGERSEERRVGKECRL